jgi:hypothetical protein
MSPRETLDYLRSRLMTMMMVMEAAGIEPASAGSDEESEGESDLAGPDAGRIASESGHEVAPTDDDPRSERGPSGSTPTPPGGSGNEPSG